MPDQSGSLKLGGTAKSLTEKKRKANRSVNKIEDRIWNLILKQYTNIIGVVMLAAILLAVAFTSTSNKGKKLKWKKKSVYFKL